MGPLVHINGIHLPTTYSEEDKDCPIGQKLDDHSFLGFTRCDIYRIQVEGLYYAEILGGFDAELQNNENPSTNFFRFSSARLLLVSNAMIEIHWVKWNGDYVKNK